MSELTIKLPYGGKYIKCKIPERNLLIIAKPKLSPPLENPKEYIREIVRKAISELDIESKVKRDSKMAIAVTDSTRPTPNYIIVPIMLEEFGKLGVKEENTVVLIATGMHSPDSPEEIKRNVGEEVVSRVKVLNHNPDDKELNKRVGVTDKGTDIEVNRLFLDADIRILTGTISPCMLVGWTGGAKTIMPGVSSRHSIEQNHLLFVKNVRKYKRGAMLGIMEGNLVREDIDDYGVKVGVSLIVNVIQDGEANVLDAYAGDIIEAHRKAVEKAKILMETKIPEKADIVIAAPGVYPHEVSLYQSGSRMLAAVENVVKEGGSIILVSSCYKGLYEGIEREAFRKFLITYRDPEEVLDLTEKGVIPSFESCISYQFVWMMEHYDITVVTDGMKPEEIRELGMSYAGTVEEAVSEALKKQGRDASIIVLPYADISNTYSKS